MKKFIALILTFIITISCTITSSFAESNLIYDILNKPATTNSGIEIIDNILGKDKDTKVKVKIVNEDTISDELESENKTVYESNNKDKNAYIKGLDVSKWNGKINWDAVERAGIKFVIIRAGYGTHVDYMFERNIKEAIKHNMIIGVYWFAYAYNNQMAIDEAHKCMDTIKKYKKHIALPVFYDLEYDSVNYAARMGVRINKSRASSYADNFCKTIEDNGYSAGIYTNIDYANRYFSQDVLNKYHTWIAQWTGRCTYKYDYIMWQCTDKYYIKNKKFDLNYFYYNRYRGNK